MVVVQKKYSKKKKERKNLKNLIEKEIYEPRQSSQLSLKISHILNFQWLTVSSKLFSVHGPNIAEYGLVAIRNNLTLGSDIT